MFNLKKDDKNDFVEDLPAAIFLFFIKIFILQYLLKYSGESISLKLF